MQEEDHGKAVENRLAIGFRKKLWIMQYELN